jgi:hypothetical protein
MGGFFIGVAMWEWIFFYTKFKLFDRLFPTTASFFLDGRSRMTPEAAERGLCHLMVRGLDGEFMRCVSVRCRAWRYVNSHPLSWRRALTARRGVCATSDLRRR